jgi:hypothetical protein
MRRGHAGLRYLRPASWSFLSPTSTGADHLGIHFTQYDSPTLSDPLLYALVGTCANSGCTGSVSPCSGDPDFTDDALTGNFVPSAATTTPEPLPLHPS